MTPNGRERDRPSIIDPTGNVKNLVESAVDRLNDLAMAETRRIDQLREAESKRVNEQLALRSEYSIQLNVAEAKRIDAIRAVDVAAVAVANERATAQAAVLANQVSASAETLRALVAATAATVAQQLQQISTQLSDRLSALEKSSYGTTGKSEGSTAMWGYVAAGAGFLLTILSIAAVLFAVLKR